MLFDVGWGWGGGGWWGGVVGGGGVGGWGGGGGGGGWEGGGGGGGEVEVRPLRVLLRILWPAGRLELPFLQILPLLAPPQPGGEILPLLSPAREARRDILRS